MQIGIASRFLHKNRLTCEECPVTKMIDLKGDEIHRPISPSWLRAPGRGLSWASLSVLSLARVKYGFIGSLHRHAARAPRGTSLDTST